MCARARECDCVHTKEGGWLREGERKSELIVYMALTFVFVCLYVFMCVYVCALGDGEGAGMGAVHANSCI